VRALASRKFDDDKRRRNRTVGSYGDANDDDDDDEDEDWNLASISVSGLPEALTAAFPLVQKRENQFY
jgi:hypothetical protein